MDGGSSLNILYAHTLRLLGIGLDQLRPSTMPFHGVAPGKRVQPLGQIDLSVWFGTPCNFRKEMLTFEVVGFLGAYHAILGRPCYAKFTADWHDKYVAWMARGELPSDRAEARRIARMAKSFALVDGELYKRAASGILQRCVPIPKGRELLRDIDAGICGHHAAPRTLVGNAFRQGFYWPTAVADASEIVRTCEGCQFYARK
jgi:hypothetical protein